ADPRTYLFTCSTNPSNSIGLAGAPKSGQSAYWTCVISRIGWNGYAEWLRVKSLTTAEGGLDVGDLTSSLFRSPEMFAVVDLLGPREGLLAGAALLEYFFDSKLTVRSESCLSFNRPYSPGFQYVWLLICPPSASAVNMTMTRTSCSQTTRQKSLK